MRGCIVVARGGCIVVAFTTMEEVSLSHVELELYQRDGFLVRKSLFTESELQQLRSAAEKCAIAGAELSALKTGTATYDKSRPNMPVRPYDLDGNRFVDIGYLTVQFEHGENTTNDVRVIEPVSTGSIYLNASTTQMNFIFSYIVGARTGFTLRRLD